VSKRIWCGFQNTFDLQQASTITMNAHFIMSECRHGLSPDRSSSWKTSWAKADLMEWKRLKENSWTANGYWSCFLHQGAMYWTSAWSALFLVTGLANKPNKVKIKP